MDIRESPLHIERGGGLPKKGLKISKKHGPSIRDVSYYKNSLELIGLSVIRTLV